MESRETKVQQGPIVKKLNSKQTKHAEKARDIQKTIEREN